MKIYLASAFGRAEEMRVIRETLDRLGHECTANWLDQETAQPGIDENGTRETLTRYAVDDLIDVLRSDLVLVFLRRELMRGGCLVELGIALGSGRRVAIVGETDVIFSYLPNVAIYRTLGDALTCESVA